MPTFKHACPYCDKFIDRAVAACPYCGQVDPFAPKRCQNCRKDVEDPAWTVCPSCGQSLIAPPPGAATSGTGAGAPAATAASAPTAPAPAAQPATAGSGAAAQNAPPPPPPRPPLNPDAAAPVLKSAGACSGCGAALPAGARFCTVCGTLAGA
ncbi:MAG: zinc-ribbon domain-containing protein [Candidatus Limnocylindrales bacterium]